jgi:lipopolysaccharide export system protein LptA
MNVLRRLIYIVYLGCLSAFFVAGIPTHAEQADRNKPLNFQTDDWTYDDRDHINVLTGHVVLTKGTLVMKADRITVYRDREGNPFMTAYATGQQRAYLRQRRDGLDEYIEGYAEKIDYDGKNAMATLTGRASVRRLQGLTTVLDEVQGSCIRYASQQNIYTASGNSSGRVRAMLAEPSDPTATTPTLTPIQREH